MKYDAIIFDLGGILINLNYQKTIDAFKELGMENFEEFYTQANQNELFDQFEIGAISPQHFVNQLLPFLPSGTSPNKVVAAWNAMILDVPLEKIELLLELKEQTDIYLLSNTNELHVPRVRQEWAKVTELPMEHFFKKTYFSNEIGRRKPHNSTFQWVCDQNQLNPTETLFIDDSIQHIEGANSIGLQTLFLEKGEGLLAYFS